MPVINHLKCLALIAKRIFLEVQMGGILSFLEGTLSNRLWDDSSSGYRANISTVHFLRYSEGKRCILESQKMSVQCWSSCLLCAGRIIALVGGLKTFIVSFLPLSLRVRKSAAEKGSYKMDFDLAKA